MFELKKNSKAAALAAAVLTVILLFCACGVKPSEGPDVKPTAVPATEKPQATEVPVTAAPATEVSETAEPATPTKEPKPRVVELDPGTDIYFDFSEFGDTPIVPDALGGAVIEPQEEGVLLSSAGNDPYELVYLDEVDQVPASEYRYLVFKVKVSQNDVIGRARYATTTDGRGVPMLTFSYTTPGKWETVVLDLAEAEEMNDDTLDGDVTFIRFDHYDSVSTLPDTYTVLLESIALFDNLEKAQAYKGLYQWPDEIPEAAGTEVPEAPAE